VRDWRHLDRRIETVSKEIETLSEQDDGAKLAPQALAPTKVRVTIASKSAAPSATAGDERAGGV
jgi:hypothetical protein